MIIAVDFDGILCENKFPSIGAPKYEVISLVRQLIDKGHEVILWTSRVDEELIAAIDWCGDRGLHFTSINENAPSNIAKWKEKYPNGTRKVYADIYIDDHNAEYAESVNQSVAYNKLVQILENGVKTWRVEEN